MTFAAYAAAAACTRLSSTLEPPGVYPALLLASEVKELADLFETGPPPGASREWCGRVRTELGDVGWAAIMWARDRDIVPANRRPEHSVAALYPHAFAAVRVLHKFTGEIAAHEQRMMRDGVVPAGCGPTAAWTVSLFDAIAGVARNFDADIQDIMRANIAKLAARAERGTIGGAGDHR
jgi:hypothetical protein